MYWFNPIEILTSELLEGATIALPNQVNVILGLLKLGQQTMFAFFLTGTLLNVVLMLASPLVLRTGRWSLFVSIFACISGLLVTSASVIATVLTLAARYALTMQSELNIRAEIGIRMFVFMWIASALTTLVFLVHSAMGCFCPVIGLTNTTEKQDDSSDKRSSISSFVRRRRGAALA
jgi:hypothetical protein